MAIKIYEKFAPRANPADGDYPYGSLKNESVPGAKDGTPLDAGWGNDYAGFDAALLAEAGVVPSGNPDKLGASQRVDAIRKLIRMGVAKVSTSDYNLVGDGVSDDTIELTKFMQDAAIAGGGIAEGGKKFRITSTISVVAASGVAVNVDMQWSKIIYSTPLTTPGQVAILNLDASAVTDDTDLNLLNLDIWADVPYFQSVTPTDRRGIIAIQTVGFSNININGYRGKNFFYGSGFAAIKFKHLNIANTHFTDVGSKYNPANDDTTPYDAAGDAIFLLDAIGNATTTITNFTSKSYAGAIGRAAIVCEELTAGITGDHIVTINNANLDGYNRIIHQEDHGKSRVTWTGGSVVRFGCVTFNLSGIDDIVCAQLNNVKVTVVDAPSFGGTFGICNFQANGSAEFNNCDISYYTTGASQDRGTYKVNGGSVNLGYAQISHVTSKAVEYSGVKFKSISGSLHIATDGAIKFTNGCELSDDMTISCNSNGSHLEFLDSDINGAVVTAVNARAKPVNIGRCYIKPDPNSWYMPNSFNSIVNHYDCEIDNVSDTIYAIAWGGGGTDMNYKNCNLRNFAPNSETAPDEPDASDLVQVVGCRLLATGAIPARPFIASINGSVIAQSNTFVDKTTAQGMTVTHGSNMFAAGLANTYTNNAGTRVL